MNQATQLDAPDKEMIVDILVGEYMLLTAERLKSMRQPFNTLSEDIQRTILNELEIESKKALKNMVKLVASVEHDVLVGFMTDVKIGKSSIDGKLSFSLNDPKKQELFEYANSQVIVVLVDPADYAQGEDGKPTAELDQPPLNGFH